MFKIENFNILETKSTMTEQIDWGLTFMNIPAWWSITKGNGIRIAVIDTGYATHSDLEGNIETSYNTIESDTIDKNSHGTFCESIIAAKANGIGIIGVACESKIITIKALGANGSGTIASLVAALQIAINAKVDLISLSLGAPRSEGSTILENVIKTAIAKGMIIVAASGNENQQEANIPAYYDGVISVAAVDQTGKKASFSNYNKRIDISAPGVDILGCGLNNTWIRASGTSFSCPMIAGLSALILAKHRANPNSKTPINNSKDLLEHLKRLTDSNGVLGTIGYGTPTKVETNE